MRKTLPFLPIAIGAVLSCSCSRLSREAKEISGNYIIPEISQTEPVMELNRNATCKVRAIKPGVITYTVEGKWNVEHDSLVMILDRSTLHVEGDSEMVGDIPTRYTRKVVDHNDINLLLEKDGVVYAYRRIQ